MWKIVNYIRITEKEKERKESHVSRICRERIPNHVFRYQAPGRRDFGRPRQTGFNPMNKSIINNRYHLIWKVLTLTALLINMEEE